MDLITEFFKAYYEDMTDYFFEFPTDKMLEEKVTKDNFIEWILTPTKIKLSDYEPLEKKLGETIPLIFKKWYSRHYSPEPGSLDTRIIFLPVPTQEDLFSELEGSLLGYGDSYQDIRDLNLIPFGSDANARGAICFDASDKSINPNDYPIVLFEYDTWDKSEIAFSNFEKMLECIIDLTKVGSTENFAKIDPKAGGIVF